VVAAVGGTGLGISAPWNTGGDGGAAFGDGLIEPRPLSPEEKDQFVAECRESAVDAGASPGFSDDAQNDAYQKRMAPLAKADLVLVYDRGPEYFALFVDPEAGSDLLCRGAYDPEARRVVSGGFSTGETAGSPPPGPGEILADTPGGSIGYSRNGRAVIVASVYLVGRVGPDAAAVTAELPDGTAIEAVVGGGWWLAWTPGQHLFATATATFEDGSTATVEAPDLGDWPPGP
jgi:hypothetical protein